jgi:hypothetical protein
MNNRDIAFTHRPVAGVSVGAYNIDGVLYVAAALANDGTSRNGNFHPSRFDTFSRATARAIIKGRIQNADNSGVRDDGLVLSYISDKTGPEFMQQFRPAFKPEADESDNVMFDGFIDSDGTEYRARMRANDMFDVINNISDSVLGHGDMIARTVAANPEFFEEALDNLENL